MHFAALHVIIVLMSLVLSTSDLVAHTITDDTASTTAPQRKNSSVGVFVEFGGSGLTMMSLNADIQFALDTTESYAKYGLRLGYGWQLWNMYLAPVLLIGSVGKRHRLEYGAGIVVKPFPHTEGLKFSQTTVKLSALLGYRFESRNGGWLFRGTFTPMYDTGNKWFFPMIGISCGASIPF